MIFLYIKTWFIDVFFIFTFLKKSEKDITNSRTGTNELYCTFTSFYVTFEHKNSDI